MLKKETGNDKGDIMKDKKKKKQKSEEKLKKKKLALLTDEKIEKGDKKKKKKEAASGSRGPGKKRISKSGSGRWDIAGCLEDRGDGRGLYRFESD